MEATFEMQMQGFWLAVAVGVILGALYDVFRILRTFLHSRRRQVFVFDMLFMFLAAVGTFITALAADNGQIRFYLLAGEIMGMCIYGLTLGEISLWITAAMIRLTTKIGAFFHRHFIDPFTQRIKAIYAKLRLKCCKKRKRQKKTAPKGKNPLKHRGKVVYNQTNKHLVRSSRKK